MNEYMHAGKSSTSEALGDHFDTKEATNRCYMNIHYILTIVTIIT